VVCPGRAAYEGIWMTSSSLPCPIVPGVHYPVLYLASDPGNCHGVGIGALFVVGMEGVFSPSPSPAKDTIMADYNSYVTRGNDEIGRRVYKDRVGGVAYGEYIQGNSVVAKFVGPRQKLMGMMLMRLVAGHVGFVHLGAGMMVVRGRRTSNDRRRFIHGVGGVELGAKLSTFPKSCARSMAPPRMLAWVSVLTFTAMPLMLA
jgi:hypothetical protein